MTNRLVDLTAAASLIAFAWLVITRLAFVLGPDSCWTTC